MKTLPSDRAGSSPLQVFRIRTERHRIGSNPRAEWRTGDGRQGPLFIDLVGRDVVAELAYHVDELARGARCHRNGLDGDTSHLKAMKRFWLLPLLFLRSVGGLYADAEIAAVQEMLKSRGFYYGEINGENNNETAAAITRFQVRSGLEVTGELNDETLRSLGLNPSQPVEPNAEDHSQPRTEAWRALREQDREFLRQTTSSQPTDQVREQRLEVSSVDQIRDFVAGFVVAGISADVEAELQFYAEKADYYDSGFVSKDFIRNDILRYNQKWPIRRYWLEGDVRILDGVDGDPIEVRYQIRYFVKNQHLGSRTVPGTSEARPLGRIPPDLTPRRLLPD